jgi:integrase
MPRAGIPERVCMALSGHKSRDVFERYNIVSEADLTAAADKLHTHLSQQPPARVLPLSGELLEVIERAHANRRLDCLHVFHVDGQPIGDFRKPWKQACTTAGLSGLIVHDLRRSAVRNMVRAGIPERVCKEG